MKNLHTKNYMLGMLPKKTMNTNSFVKHAMHGEPMRNRVIAHYAIGRDAIVVLMVGAPAKVVVNGSAISA